MKRFEAPQFKQILSFFLFDFQEEGLFFVVQRENYTVKTWYPPKQIRGKRFNAPEIDLGTAHGALFFNANGAGANKAGILGLHTTV